MTGRIGVEQLQPLATDASDRDALLRRAVVAFAGALGFPKNGRATAASVGEERGEALALNLFALVAVLGSAAAHFQDALDKILDHEARFWSVSGSSEDVKLALRVSVVILALRGGGLASPPALVRDLAGSPYFDDLTRAEKEQVVQKLVDLYGTAGQVDAIQPDRIAEHLVAKELERMPDLAMAWLTRAEAQHLANGLTMLDRCAQNYPPVADSLASILNHDLENLAPIATAVAVETGDPIGRILAECLQAEPAPSIAYRLESQLPVWTTALRELAVTATQQALEYIGPDWLEEERGLEQARLLNNLGGRLSELGRREEALEAAKEAADVYRGLAEARPDAFLPDLAGSLNNLGNRLSELGACRSPRRSKVCVRYPPCSRPTSDPHDWLRHLAHST